MHAFILKLAVSPMKSFPLYNSHFIFGIALLNILRVLTFILNWKNRKTKKKKSTSSLAILTVKSKVSLNCGFPPGNDLVVLTSFPILILATTAFNFADNVGSSPARPTAYVTLIYRDPFTGYYIVVKDGYY